MHLEVHRLRPMKLHFQSGLTKRLFILPFPGDTLVCRTGQGYDVIFPSVANGVVSNGFIPCLIEHEQIFAIASANHGICPNVVGVIVLQTGWQGLAGLCDPSHGDCAGDRGRKV